MPGNLVFTVRFLQPYSHGRGEGGDPEWPPSPLRLYQSLVAAAAGHWNERSQLEYAKPSAQWLESLPPPEIVASTGIASDVPTQFYVPDNTADLLVPQWKKGNVSEAPKRAEKVVRPTHLPGETVHYLYPLPDGQCPHLETLRAAARSVTHLGWGVDMVAADAAVISAEEAAKLSGNRWCVVSSGGTPLRVPRVGTLKDLIRKHADFLHRISEEGFRPVPPLREFEVVQYRPRDMPLQRPFRIFELRNLDGSRFRYSHRRLIHIAGMVRHLAIRSMASRAVLESLYPDRAEAGEPFQGGSPPAGIADPDRWVETYIAGHNVNDTRDHRQLSYLPLPSIGHAHSDPGIRRVMIAGPVGDGAWLEHVARRLAGQQLQPLNQKKPEFGVDEDGLPKPGPLLVPLPLSGDGVTRCYTRASHEWDSFTPVILPGHDDHKPTKTRALIEAALRQSGIDQPCEFEWSAFSAFRSSYSAHKYDENHQPQGFIRPKHLGSQTAVHLKIRFGKREVPNDERSRWIPAPFPIPGPIVIGAGRHCGLGLMAARLGE